jgi:tRNA(Ile)-lysidine synthase
MMGLRCGAVLIDHGLQEVTADVVERSARQCRSFGLDPVMTRAIHIDHSRVAGSRGLGEEAAAREARYEAICDEAQKAGAAAVLLAHTLDDQAETVLLGLIRNTGLASVAGMEDDIRVGGVRFLRPVLRLTRGQTTQVCMDSHIQWWDDPTNEGVQGDPLRSQLRGRVIPVLKEVAGESVNRHLAVLGDAVSDNEKLLNDLAQEIVERAVTVTETNSTAKNSADIDIAALLAETRSRPAMVARVIARVLDSLGVEHSKTHVSGVVQLVLHWHGQKVVNFPKGFSAYRTNNVIKICHDEMHEQY